MLFLMNVALFAAVYLVVGHLERRPALRFRELAAPRPFLASDVAWYGVAVAATAVSAFLVRPVLASMNIGPIAASIDGLPFAAQLAVGLVTFDLVSFLVHRRLHRSDVLWHFHKVHHSSLELDALATTRAHMAENVVRFVPGQLVLFVAGIPASVVATVVALAALYGISNHSNLDVRARWMEAMLVTPRLHRRHHVPSTTQHNYGTILTIWDRLFGTLVRADTSDSDRYGVPGEIESYPQRFTAAVRQPFADVRAMRRNASSPGDTAAESPAVRT